MNLTGDRRFLPTRRAALRLPIAVALLAGLVLCGTMDVPAYDPVADRAAILPATMLWAWERNEDLQSMDVRKAGVAFLSRTCVLRGDRVIVRPRLQPLRVPSGCVLEAVVRIESDRSTPPSLTTGQMDVLIREVVAASKVQGTKAVQIDFDARRSQRPFYKELLRALRSTLPDSMPLSITALASWCMYDRWVAELPVDQVVPMVFRMGLDGTRIRSDIRKRGEFLSGACRRAIGVCTDEPLPVGVSAARTYVFHPKRWTEEALRCTLEEVSR